MAINDVCDGLPHINSQVLANQFSVQTLDAV